MSKKVWFITGASRGFGRVWAEAALKQGDKVAATARSLKGVADLAERYGKGPISIDNLRFCGSKDQGDRYAENIQDREQVRWNFEAGRSPADPTTSKEIQQNHWNDKAEETMTNDERIQREANLIATIRMKLPDFAKMCADDTEPILLHQDAFAADYQEDEYMLLGTAIKYAGLRGKGVRVIGKNRTTLGDQDTIQ